jgi:hypothetical protein
MGEVIVMLKRIVKTIVLSMLFLLAIPVFCYGFSIDLQLSTEYAKTGDSITISGQADANSWISIKVLDEGQNIIYFNAVKSDEYGRYSDSFIVPENIEGCLTVVAGAGANVASQTLLVGRLSTQVSLELSSYEAIVGDSITVFGTADPNSWVALKAVDEEGSILFFDTVKADGDGNYSLDLIIPEMAAGSLKIIAGYGDNTASRSITIRAELDECFIATAAFGSKFEPSVALLRAFRDKYLLNNNMGQALVKFYYQNSPPLANYIAASEPLKALVRILLIPFIVMAYISFHPLWICLMLGMGFALLLWHRRKRNWQLKGN